MYEVNFNEKTNIEEDIKAINKETRNSSYYIKVLLSLLVIVISVPLFLKLFPTATILTKGLLVIANAIVATGLFMTIDGISQLITNIKKNKAKNNLKEITKVLSQNRINTNTKELSNSVILNNSKKTTIEISEDEEYTVNSEEIKDKYYLFLDKDSNIQGILERTTKDEENNEDNKYYILEEQDIKPLEPKVTKVKKLVRTKDLEQEKQK